MRTLIGAVLVVAIALAAASIAPPASARGTLECGFVSVGGHKYFVLATGASCALAKRYARKLIPERSSGTGVAKLAGGPAGYKCGASGRPQRFGRCFKGAASFSWIRAA